MSEEEIEEAIEEEIEDTKIEQMELEHEMREDLSEDDAVGYGMPEEKQSYDKFKFLAETRDLSETIRTANLSKGELGMPLFPVRFWLNLELYARVKGYQLIGAWMHEKALTTTHTSLSKDGFLINALNTRIRSSTRGKIKPKQEVNQNAKN